ncbi:DUF2802 domain-containing protein [Aliiglaciecola sp. CAU 1673]|uniref:DUF2802 domain-containing protein n=1 Tax=Aliiglaciecola sp. CAU 1673 TaxID=3032595 RepID=UPI0023DB0D08|nr:DUF2802 domain-containing protein [Aliiglaciecola sp. CAU 1673]MDF2177480.1 DUF2802 domain-containing protein [Aliiglaciecola sp. CAU 1673]
MNWSEWIWPLLMLGLVLLSIYCVYLHRKLLQLATSLSDQKGLHEAHKQSQSELQEGLHELRVGSLGVGDKVKALILEVQELQSRQQELAQMDPQTKRYSHAVKLLQKGASIEELMEACELPRAEAEMLFSVHGKKG